MSNTKYRLGNQPEEYELVTKYLGWIPDGFPDWQSWIRSEDEKKYAKELHEILKDQPPVQLIIVSPDKKEKVTLLMDHQVSKDAFPLSFYGEKRAEKWWQFYIVALQEKPDEKFIIPLY